MKLSSPVTITPPSVKKPDGSEQTFKPIVLENLDLTIVDNYARKVAMVQIRPFPKPITLWEGDAYDKAGDYTQAQVEARTLEVLGKDPKAALEGLFIVPKPAPTPAPTATAKK